MPTEDELFSGLDLGTDGSGGDGGSLDRSSDAGGADHARSSDRGRGDGSDLPDRKASGKGDADRQRADRGKGKAAAANGRDGAPDRGKSAADGGSKPTLRDSIKQAFREVEAREADDVAAERKSGDRQRGPDGKFLKDGAVDAAITQEITPRASIATEEQGAGSGQNVDAAGAPPKGWDAAAKADWDKVPASVRAAVTKRESDMDVGAQRLQERYGPIHNAVTTLMPVFQRYGHTPQSGLNNLVQWAHAMERNPAAAIAKLVADYKIDVTKLPAVQPQPTNGATQASGQLRDPRVDQLLAQQQQEATRRRVEEQTKGLTYFEEVRHTMGAVIQKAAANNDQSILTDNQIDLVKVYKKAIQDHHPTILAKIAADMKRKKAEGNRSDINRARRTAVSVTGGSPPPDQGEIGKLPKGSSVRDHIKAAIRDVRA